MVLWRIKGKSPSVSPCQWFCWTTRNNKAMISVVLQMILLWGAMSSGFSPKCCNRLWNSWFSIMLVDCRQQYQNNALNDGANSPGHGMEWLSQTIWRVHLLGTQVDPSPQFQQQLKFGNVCWAFCYGRDWETKSFRQAVNGSGPWESRLNGVLYWLGIWRLVSHIEL